MLYAFVFRRPVSVLCFNLYRPGDLTPLSGMKGMTMLFLNNNYFMGTADAVCVMYRIHFGPRGLWDGASKAHVLIVELYIANR